MSIKSMTGFARAEGTHEGATWHWEVRSVNGRGLDIRLRLPSGNEPLEPRVREAVGRHVTRGSVSITLAVERSDSDVEIRLNERALQQVMHAADRVRDLTNATPPRVDGLIAIKGVLDIVEPDHRKVTGHVEIASASCLQDADRVVVVEGEDRRRRLREVEQDLGGLPPAEDLEVCFDLERGIG